MNIKIRLSSILLLIAALGILSACGSKRNPTGGEKDTVKPEVLASLPAEFGDISKGMVEISFSKQMDRNSLANSIYIYPPVQNKKVSLDGFTLKIKLNETLKQDTNYYITLSTRLKDTRGNALERNQTLVFSSGKLSGNRIAGNINYEESGDNGLPVELSLFSADSLLVYANRLKGNTYVVDNLNPGKHNLRSYIDKNLNGRYDFGSEPFFEDMSDGSQLANLDINLAYADTSKARIKSVNVISSRELQVLFTEPVVSFKTINISSVKPLEIDYKLIDNDRISILTAPMDSVRYKLSVNGIVDKKGNETEPLEIQFSGGKKTDAIAPFITKTNPRNGASVSTLSPILELHFSEIIPAGAVYVKLVSGTEEIPLKQLSSTGKIHRFQPTMELANYRSHTLIVLSNTKDYSGNKLDHEYELQFLPLKR